jgi:hypothetical protein
LLIAQEGSPTKMLKTISAHTKRADLIFAVLPKNLSRDKIPKKQKFFDTFLSKLDGSIEGENP